MAENLLSYNDPEKVIMHVRQHWGVFAPPLVPVGLGVLIMFLALLKESATALLCLSLLLILPGLAYLGVVLIGFLGTDLVLTNRRIVGHSGLMNRRGLQVPLPQIERIELSQDPLGKIIGYGTLKIYYAGDLFESVPGLAEAAVLRGRIYQQLRRR
jgi:membrane protein YdbS with pleckstrin-like domain